mmetsp:Transcript_15307/g.23582  ORF Transcript_15307/g.23582 Transcript_15307/m.23582 type:complete len:202 (-) Transcript_15307:63-668(-)
MDFRSRLNSKVAWEGCSVLHTFTFADERVDGEVDAESENLPPIFSARTHNAASVGSPIRSYVLPAALGASFPTMVASLHSADTAATSVSAPVGLFCISTECSIPSIVPSGEYDTPLIACSSTRELSSNSTSDTAVISFVVRVPVLSVQMTLVHPSVSTDGSLRTITLRLAIRRVPRLRHNVITAGRPSGMAATPSATATFA